MVRSVEFAAIRLQAGLTRISDLFPIDQISAFEAARHVLAEFLPVDAFYVARHDPSLDRIVFESMFDEARVELGSIAPIEDGPTSRVLRTGGVLLIQDNATPWIHSQRFGNRERRTPSQLHVPMRSSLSPMDGAPAGVLSVQCYEANAYAPEDVALTRIVADFLATLINAHQLTQGYRQDHQDYRRQVKIQQSILRDQTRHITDLFFQIQRELNRIVITGSHQEGVDLVRATLEQLGVVAQYTASGDLAPPIPSPNAGSPSPTTAGTSTPTLELTHRERAVLNLFPRRNHEISVLLKIEVTTVRYHCKNIYRKLNVHSKAEALDVGARLNR